MSIPPQSLLSQIAKFVTTNELLKKGKNALHIKRYKKGRHIYLHLITWTSDSPSFRVRVSLKGVGERGLPVDLLPLSPVGVVARAAAGPGNHEVHSSVPSVGLGVTLTYWVAVVTPCVGHLPSPERTLARADRGDALFICYFWGFGGLSLP